MACWKGVWQPFYWVLIIIRYHWFAVNNRYCRELLIWSLFFINIVSDIMRPITVPEFSDFDEDLTSVKLRWKPLPSPHFDLPKHGKYTVETWEPIRREWKPVVQGIPDTSYHLKGLPKRRDQLFRVRMDTDIPALSQPSFPISLSTMFSKSLINIFFIFCILCICQTWYLR